MTDSLEEAVRIVEEKERSEAERRDRVTRMRQLKQRRDEAIESDGNFRFYEHLMKQKPGQT